VVELNDGELEYAIRIAKNHFDEWNNKTNAIPRRRNWYPQILDIIEDSVRIGVEIHKTGIDSDFKDVLNDNKEII
jgi:hypothetical protein